jgi:hypothetical protein
MVTSVGKGLVLVVVGPLAGLAGGSGACPSTGFTRCLVQAPGGAGGQRGQCSQEQEEGFAQQHAKMIGPCLQRGNAVKPAPSFFLAPASVSISPMSSHLPAWLHQAITIQLDQVPLKRLRSGYAALSAAYGAHPTFEPGGDDVARAQAYMAARMPATYAAVEQALAQVPMEALVDVRSVLDLGAGPGTATWALRERLPDLALATLVETDAATVALAKVLAESRPAPSDLNMNWQDQPALLAAKTATQHDVVLMSYCLEEAGAEEAEALVRAAWAAARQGLLIVEPGTPAGFARLLKMRDMLLAEGGHLIAPCPHTLACPLAAGALGGDLKQKPTAKERFDNMWCHFGVRLERRGLHRLIKGGDLGYEDEKFSFLYFSRTKLSSLAPYRVLAWPKRISRHIELDLCSKSGKREKSFYNRRNTAQNIRNAARRLAWGDAWDPAKVPESVEDEDFDD